MDRIGTWMMAMITLDGMALGSAATIGLFMTGGAIRIRVESRE